MAAAQRSARPPSRSRAAIERTNTPWSSGSTSIRVRSPSSAPPRAARGRVDRDHADRPRRARARRATRARDQGRLADARRPGEPDHVRRAARPRRHRAAPAWPRLAGRRLDPGQRPRQRAPCRPRAASAQRRAALNAPRFGPRAPPAPRPAARSARGRASRRRSRARPARRSAIEAGSPPCSPQMPSLRSGRAARPRSAAICDQLADALDVERLERVARRRCPSRRRRSRNLPAVVADEAERRLGEVVGAEAEELGVLGDLAGAAAPRAAARSSCRPGSRARRPAPSTDLGRHRVDPLLDQLAARARSRPAGS